MYIHYIYIYIYLFFPDTRVALGFLAVLLEDSIP